MITDAALVEAIRAPFGQRRTPRERFLEAVRENWDSLEGKYSSAKDAMDGWIEGACPVDPAFAHHIVRVNCHFGSNLAMGKRGDSVSSPPKEKPSPNCNIEEEEEEDTDDTRKQDPAAPGI